MACNGKGLGRLGRAELRDRKYSTGYNLWKHWQTSIQQQAGGVPARRSEWFMKCNNLVNAK